MPVGAGHITIGIARARTDGQCFLVEMFAGLPVVPKLKQHPLKIGDPFDPGLDRGIGRPVPMFLVGFDPIANPDNIGLDRLTVVFSNGRVEVVVIALGLILESLETFPEHFVASQIFGHENDPAETVALGRQLDFRRI